MKKQLEPHLRGDDINGVIQRLLNNDFAYSRTYMVLVQDTAFINIPPEQVFSA